MTDTPNLDRLLRQCVGRTTRSYMYPTYMYPEERAELDTLKQENERLRRLAALVVQRLRDAPHPTTEYVWVQMERLALTTFPRGDVEFFAQQERQRAKAIETLRAQAAMAEEHASWIRRGPPLDHGNTPHDIDWLCRYESLTAKDPT